MAELHTWNALAAMEGSCLDAALFDAGCAPADVECITWSVKDLHYGVRVHRGTLQVASWWSPTSDWNDCIPLVWKARASLSVAPQPGIWVAWTLHQHGAPLLYATTEAEARHQLCRLALWRAWQMKEEESTP